MPLEMLRLLAVAGLEVCEGVCDTIDETEGLRAMEGRVFPFRDERDLDRENVVMMDLCDDEPEWTEAPSLNKETGDGRGVNDRDGGP